MLRNGNYLTGDIVSLEYGILSLKTDQMGTPANRMARGALGIE